MRDNVSELEVLIKKLAKEKKIKYIVVTSGSKGSIFLIKKIRNFIKLMLMPQK